MNPQRQRLLKAMEVNDAPMTPKQLSNILKISASSASLHIRKLEELGLVAYPHNPLPEEQEHETKPHSASASLPRYSPSYC